MLHVVRLDVFEMSPLPPVMPLWSTGEEGEEEEEEEAIAPGDNEEKLGIEIERTNELPIRKGKTSAFMFPVLRKFYFLINYWKRSISRQNTLFAVLQENPFLVACLAGISRGPSYIQSCQA